MTALQTTLLTEAKEICARFHENTLEVMRVLYELRESEAWKHLPDFEDLAFGQYAEQELGISQGFASKLANTWHHYCVLNDIPVSKLEGVAVESLYLASKTEGDVELQLSRAKTLKRSELRQEKAETDAHTPTYGTFCSTCWLSESNHP